MKLKKIILMFVLLDLLMVLTLLFFFVSARDEPVVMQNANSSTLKLKYGINENGNWEGFADSALAEELHKNLKNDYVRVWISSQWYRPSTIPVKSDGRVDYINSDKFINAVLKTGATPFIVFAHAPGTYGEAHGEVPPENDHEFAQYVADFVMYYKQACENGQLAAQCDVNDWYFEIWNEPFNDIWWDGTVPRYVRMYNVVALNIKAIAPDAKVGGFGTSFFPGNIKRIRQFLENSDMDFISLHHYGNTYHEYANDAKKMREVKNVHYDTVLDLRRLIDESEDQPVEIVMSEYAPSYKSDYRDQLDEQYTAAWYASALIWQIKSQEVAVELYYSGTSLHSDIGFGMWSNEFNAWPVYDMKVQFVRYNIPGSLLLDDGITDRDVDALLVQNEMGRHLTIVNKINEEQVVQTEWGSIDLEPYEVRFMSV